MTLTPERAEELKQQRLKNLEKGRLKRKRRPALSLPDDIQVKPAPEVTPEPVIPPQGKPDSAPPPLEPLSPPPLDTSPAAPSPSLHPKTVGKVCDSFIRGLLGIGSSLLPGIEIQVTAIDDAEQELLGGFVIPVLDKYLPRLKDSPEYALGFVVFGLYTGRVKISRKAKAVNVGNTPAEAAPPPAPPPPPPPREESISNLGNAGNLEVSK